METDHGQSEKIIIQNTTFYDPNSKQLIEGNMVVENGIIIALGDPIANFDSTGAVVINGKDLTCVPGFIDLHAHLREPGFEYKETIETGTSAAVKGGFTTVCAMPNTSPAIDNEATVNFVKEKARTTGKCRVYPIGAVTKNREGQSIVDFMELYEAGVVGFSDDGDPVSDAEVMRLALLYVSGLDVPIMNHCQDLTLSKNGVMADGDISELLGLPGIPNAAEEVMVSRDISLASSTNSKLHICHVSSAGSVEMIRLAKKRGVKVTAEVCPHHLIITDESVSIGTGNGENYEYDTNSKVYPPLRTMTDISALVEGLIDGTIDCIATDHAPHDVVSKVTTFEDASFGISVFETAFGSLMELVNKEIVTFSCLIEALTIGPAKVLGDEYIKYATLEVGTPADIAILDLNQKWIVDVEKFVSKGKNTPLNGRVFTGKVVATIVDGYLMFDELKH
ncbi:MAG TPA: dihydroorotase [Dehalococcoidia bacterium]|jgi:dihydroorotase|nr:dihydroorotase [Dehalococcoidia bacterium]|tara:strand:- start:768 stop:2117 length:1350 start_codon:yes stop_codon:yes gene_type:complete